MSISRQSIRMTAFFFAVLTILATYAVALSASRASAETWSADVIVTPIEQAYDDIEIQIGQNGLYILTFVYDPQSDAPVYLYRSADDGLTWTENELFNKFRAEPSMCVYPNGSEDNVIVVSNGEVYKSNDSGDTFVLQSYLPLPYSGLWWRFMAAGTNASWFGGPQDDDIYVVGGVAFGVPWEGGSYQFAFTKSNDGGFSWETPIYLSHPGYSYWYPKLLSDGKNLYAIYGRNDASLGNSNENDLYVQSSSDWGQNWSTEKLLLQRDPDSLMIWLHSAQHLNDDSALLTLADYGVFDDPEAITTGEYGYFHYSNMSFEEVGRVERPASSMWAGFAGKLAANDTLLLAWSELKPDLNRTIWFTTSSDTGLSHTGVVLPPDDLPEYPGLLLPIAAFLMLLTIISRRMRIQNMRRG